MKTKTQGICRKEQQAGANGEERRTDGDNLKSEDDASIIEYYRGRFLSKMLRGRCAQGFETIHVYYWLLES